MKIIEKLIYLRKNKNLSQEDLGNVLGVARQTISKWELGETTPEMDKLIKMSELFDISLDELKTFVENKLFNRLNAKKNALMETKTLNELIDETNGYKFMGYYYQDSKSSLQYDINYRVVVTYNVNETTGEFADSGDYLLAANSAILMFEVENVIPDYTGLVTGTTRLPSGDYTISALYESNIEDKDKNNKYYSEDRYVLTKIGDEYMRCNYYKINNADETHFSNINLYKAK